MIFLKFTKGKTRAGEAMEAHQAWLAQGFSDGVFLAAGSLDDGAGGAILAFGEDRDALEARVAADPFVQEGIVTAEITGFTLARTDARLGFLKVAA
ncbi:YciI family protein [Tritonibacter mobilis]|uniref:YciI family protein n=1 Tax=Tritonibacter mobilis TaxID=379347 RepID=UPI001E2BAB78|nr:YciI family protein [Tritonibacter mobilis]